MLTISPCPRSSFVGSFASRASVPPSQSAPIIQSRNRVVFIQHSIQAGKTLVRTVSSSRSRSAQKLPSTRALLLCVSFLVFGVRLRVCVRVYAGLSFFLSCSSPSSSFSVVVRTGDEGLTKCAQNRQPSQKIHSSHSAHPPSSLIAHCVCKSVKERVCRLSARLLAVRLEYRTVRWLGLGCATTGHPTATNNTHPETFATLLILYFRRPHEVPHMHHHLALRRNRKHRKTQKKTHKKEKSGRWDSFVRCSLSVRCSLLVVRERRRERAGLSTVCHLPPATVTQSTRVKKFKSSAKNYRTDED